MAYYPQQLVAWHYGYLLMLISRQWGKICFLSWEQWVVPRIGLLQKWKGNMEKNEREWADSLYPLVVLLTPHSKGQRELLSVGSLFKTIAHGGKNFSVQRKVFLCAFSSAPLPSTTLKVRKCLKWNDLVWWQLQKEVMFCHKIRICRGRAVAL